MVPVSIRKVQVAQQVKIDSDAVRSLAELLRETDLTEIEYQVDSLRIKVSRTVQQTVVPVHMSPPPPHHHSVEQSSMAAAMEAEMKANDLEHHPGVMEAQMVGTVYLSPGPEAPPFISLGEAVSQGQTVFIIEAMKVMNLIKAPRSGIIKHIFVKDAQPVEYGDPIIIIE
ncbi:MAG: acetyl-CoA carboxylase biotin carboxyl carrier protein [Holosporaceae bacterium]|jgi:acetyl-CoA carboxylase biotin carboxyl carrier protein|nr:acetyl-CoA carboxylase biotin carboxyl carrier protein [Holosporaceae bacterium]